jgi:hypothetical protein
LRLLKNPNPTHGSGVERFRSFLQTTPELNRKSHPR